MIDSSSAMRTFTLVGDRVESAPMRVKVRFFGLSSERAGCTEREFEVAEATVAAVAAAVRKEVSGLDGVRFAVGTDYASEETLLKDGDVVSVIPPVGGG